jgi:nitrogen fixation protein FixH
MENTKTPPRSPNLWPVSIIAFFAVAIVGCGSFIAFCSRHPADLVAADYYEQEVRYQGQMERTQRAQAQAQLASVSYDAVTRLIRISLPPSHSLTNASGDIQLYRPSAETLDRRLKLEPDAGGVQTIDAATLAPGLWKVRISWRVEGEDYFVDQKVVVGAKAS